MAIIIQLPYYPLEIVQRGEYVRLDANLALLKEAKGYKTGIQVIMGTTQKMPFAAFMDDPSGLFRKFRSHVGEEIWKHSSVHLPTCPDLPDARLHMGKATAYAFLDKITSSVEEAGIHTVIVHSDTVYQFKSPFSWNEKAKEEAAHFAGLAVKLAKKHPAMTFAYENMPLPLRGDVSTDPALVKIEPNMMTISHVQAFLGAAKGQKNINFCFDTAHYMTTRATVTYLRDHPLLLKDEHVRMIVGSLAEGPVLPDEKQAQAILKAMKLPLLDSIIKGCGGRITDVQLADVDGGWIPATGKEKGKPIGDSLPLEKGRRNYEEIKQALLEIKKLSTTRDIAISIDVEEEKYTQLKNQSSTMREVLRILG